MNNKLCKYCNEPLDKFKRKDALFCCDSHRISYFMESKQRAVKEPLKVKEGNV